MIAMKLILKSIFVFATTKFDLSMTFIRYTVCSCHDEAKNLGWNLANIFICSYNVHTCVFKSILVWLMVGVELPSTIARQDHPPSSSSNSSIVYIHIHYIWHVNSNYVCRLHIGTMMTSTTPVFITPLSIIIGPLWSKHQYIYIYQWNRSINQGVLNYHLLSYRHLPLSIFFFL